MQLLQFPKQFQANLKSPGLLPPWLVLHAAIKDLNIVAGEFEIDPIPVRSKQSDIEAFWEKLISSIQLFCRLHSISLEPLKSAVRGFVEFGIYSSHRQCHALRRRERSQACTEVLRADG